MAQGKKLNFKERMKRLHSSSKDREKVFKDLIAHIRKGYSLDCFGPLSDTMIKKFCEDYPVEFDENELVEAMRGAKEHWEDIGHKQALGSCLGNSRSWYYNMVNRYGWHEKAQVETEHKGAVSVNVVSYASKKPPQ
jgi:hypothetical protein